MPKRINRAIELLADDQPIYYAGAHSGHVLTEAQGRIDAGTWADYVNVGMEHGAFDMAGLAAYLAGLVAAGPTRSGHRTPAVFVEAPVEGSTADVVRANAWMFRQILGRGVHGILLCQAETAEAVRAFVEACRYPINRIGVGDMLGVGRRGVGSESTAAPIWGLEREAYIRACDPWPLNPDGELLLGVKIESLAALPNIDAILDVPGIGFAEMGPGDLSHAMGHLHFPDPLPPDLVAIRDRVRAACLKRGIAFLEGAKPGDVAAKIDGGARVISGGREDTALAGRAHTRRTMRV
jgi:2-keto-3-deoxy-L-rhamnonate aldolase RhmA